MDYKVQLYTGEGKGKTTAALGLALRAAGHGKRTFIGQFMKGSFYGELRALASLEAVEIVQLGWPECIRREQVAEFHRERTREGLELCAQKAASGAFELVILDEILVSVLFGLIEEKAVLDFVERFRGRVELVLTGRGASEGLLAAADLVTQMRCVRHYYEAGLMAREGIEF